MKQSEDESQREREHVADEQSAAYGGVAGGRGPAGRQTLAGEGPICGAIDDVR